MFKLNSVSAVAVNSIQVADPQGSPETPSKTKLFKFHGEFSKKSGKMTSTITKSTPHPHFVKLNP